MTYRTALLAAMLVVPLASAAPVKTEPPPTPDETRTAIAELKAQVEALRAEVEALKQELAKRPAAAQAAAPQKAPAPPKARTFDPKSVVAAVPDIPPRRCC
jgi:hypothetical protein